MYELALFAGAGGGILGGVLLGHRCIGAVEIEPYARNVLAARQQDGSLPAFPIWDDVRTFTKRNNACRRYFRFLRSIRHSLVISGGFPCQDISTAGKGDGIDGERSGLWKEFARIIREIRPRYAFVENSPALTSRGLGVVHGDLAAMGYDANWCVLGAADAIWSYGDPSADQERRRIWILAFPDTDGFRQQQPEGNFTESGRRLSDILPTIPDAENTGHKLPLAERASAEVAEIVGDSFTFSDADGIGEQIPEAGQQSGIELPLGFGGDRCADGSGSWWSTEPPVCRVADGVADQLDIHGVVTSAFLGRVASGVPMRTKRIAALGNGQVPATAALAWRILTQLES